MILWFSTFICYAFLLRLFVTSFCYNKYILILSTNKTFIRKMYTNMDKSLMLNQIKKHLEITKDAEFARLLGLKPQTLSSWHSRNTYDIELLYSKCGFVNAEWLITGEGEMLKEQKNEIILSTRGDDEWKDKFYEVQNKYTLLLEEYNIILKGQLREVLSIDKSASTG